MRPLAHVVSLHLLPSWMGVGGLLDVPQVAQNTAAQAAQGIETVKADLRRRVGDADRYEEGLKRARRKWEAGKALNRLNKLTGKAADNQMKQILNEEADSSIERELSEGLAAMDISAILAEAKAIPNNPSPVLEVQAVEVREKVRA